MTAKLPSAAVKDLKQVNAIHIHFFCAQSNLGFIESYTASKLFATCLKKLCIVFRFTSVFVFNLLDLDVTFILQERYCSCRDSFHHIFGSDDAMSNNRNTECIQAQSKFR